MFTPENAVIIIKKLRKLSLEILYKKHHGYAVRVSQIGVSEPIICSKIHNIKNKKEAVSTICDVLKWAERIYRENKGDKTKRGSVNKLIPQIERAFALEVDQVLTSNFKI
jgi:hypothetical protein